MSEEEKRAPGPWEQPQGPHWYRELLYDEVERHRETINERDRLKEVNAGLVEAVAKVVQWHKQRRRSEGGASGHIFTELAVALAKAKELEKTP